MSDSNNNPAPPSVHRASTKSPLLYHPFPSPDAQLLKGEYLQNVLRIEEAAERLASLSSNISDEIRRLSRSYHPNPEGLSHEPAPFPSYHIRSSLPYIRSPLNAPSLPDEGNFVSNMSSNAHTTVTAT